MYSNKKMSKIKVSRAECAKLIVEIVEIDEYRRIRHSLIVYSFSSSLDLTRAIFTSINILKFIYFFFFQKCLRIYRLLCYQSQWDFL